MKACLQNKTLFGWTFSATDIVVGTLKTNCSFVITDETNELLKHFWELQDLPKDNNLSHEEVQCENLFEGTTVPLDDCRRKSHSNVRGCSLNAAERIFQWLGNRLDENDDLKQQYKEFINGIIQMEHFEPMPNEALKEEASDFVYLRNHYIITALLCLIHQLHLVQVYPEM